MERLENGEVTFVKKMIKKTFASIARCMKENKKKG